MIIIYSLLFVLIAVGFLIFPSLNSDSLYIEVFQSSFLRDISMGDIWLQMPASAYFPDQLIYFLSRKIFDINQSLFMVALSKIFLLSGSIFYFCKSIITTSSKKSLLIGFIVSSIFIPIYKLEYFSLFRIEFNHFAPVILNLLFLPILLKAKSKNYFFIYLFLFIGSFISTISSVISLVIIFSFTISILLDDFKYKKLATSLFLKKDLIRMIFVIYVGSITGYFTYTKYININFYGDKSFLSFPSLRFLRYITSPFPLSTYISIPIIFLIIIFGLISLNNSNLKPEILKLNRINIRATSIATIIYLTLGVLKGQGYYRYFYPFIIIYLINLVYMITIDKTKLFNYSKFLFAIALFVPNYKNYDKYFIKSFRTTSIKDSEISNCINSTIKTKDTEERVGIGILNYWDSNINFIRIPDKKIDLVELRPDGSPRLWMQNIGTSKSKYDNFYLLLRKDQKFLSPFELKIHKVCNDPNLEIYSFGKNTGNFIQYYKNFSKFYWSMLFNSKEKSIYMGSDLPSTTKSLRNKPTLLSINPGYAHYGPYINLKPGRYNADIFYSFINNDKKQIPDIEVGCLTKENTFNKLNKQKLIEGKGIKKNLTFNVSKNDNCKLEYEVRTFINKGQKMYINYLVINKIS